MLSLLKFPHTQRKVPLPKKGKLSKKYSFVNFTRPLRMDRQNKYKKSEYLNIKTYACSFNKICMRPPPLRKRYPAEVFRSSFGNTCLS